MWILIFGAWTLAGLFIFWRDTIEVRALAALSLTIFFAALYVISRGKWIGGADIKIAPFLGLWAGWPGTFVLFVLAYVLGAVVGIFLLATGRAERRDEVPFLPFLLGAGFVSFLWGERIYTWYLSLFL